MMGHMMGHREERDSGSQRASVTELISDIDAEMRLHVARIQEFLDGTAEFGAVNDTLARVQLLRTLQTITGALSDLDELTGNSDAYPKNVIRQARK